MKFRGKRYKKAHEAVSQKASYGLEEAVKTLKDSAETKFDATAEVHFNLNIDPKQADQLVRGTVTLPHGSGKSLKIAAVVSDDKVKKAKDAGADEAGLEDLIAEFEKGNTDFDLILATPDVMSKLGKAAKNLGQKGLMPNPKSGTVTDDIETAIQEFKRGKIEYRNDKQGNVHAIFGKTSFKEAELENNLRTVIEAIRDAKPSGVKSTYIKSITICSSMGPGIRLDIGEVMNAL